MIMDWSIILWIIVGIVGFGIVLIWLIREIRYCSKQEARCKNLEEKLKSMRDINRKTISENLSLNRKIGCINYNNSIPIEDIMRNYDNLDPIIEQMKLEFGKEIVEKCAKWYVCDDPIHQIKYVKGRLYYVEEPIFKEEN
jgi:hypothetical protein